MKTWRTIGVLFLLLLAGGAGRFMWQEGEPRRASIASVRHLSDALSAADGPGLLSSLILPAALQGRTPAEQTEFLTKALRDEISPEGVAALQQNGHFGALAKVFPAEAASWAGQAGVKPEDCVAFRMERDKIRAEVVLVREGETYRVVRCNNVKQLAAAKH